MPKEISAGAVVFRQEDNQIYYLLLRYESGHWGFSKGHIEGNENEIETVQREVEEETGLKNIKIIKGFKENIKYFFKNTYNLKNEEKKKASWIFKIVTFYLAETQGKEIKISKEHSDYKWLPYKEAIKQTTFKNSKETLKKANNFILSKNLQVSFTKKRTRVN
ncbi:NUDIX domain-containing protein [Patescibacteria group bacterium]|nr:NUDIX domain-containing protein [Patescibacteria group bacterium]